MVGSAVETMVESSAASSRTSSNPLKTTRTWRCVSDTGASGATVSGPATSGSVIGMRVHTGGNEAWRIMRAEAEAPEQSRAPLFHDLVHGGNHDEREHGGRHHPADHGAAKWRAKIGALAVAQRHRHHARDEREGRH